MAKGKVQSLKRGVASLECKVKVMFLLISTEQNIHFSVAIGTAKILKLKTVNKEYRQSELLLKTIDQLLGSKKPAAIFVVRGPGAFAALRTGISTANALAFAWKTPVIGVRLKPEWSLLDEKGKLAKVWSAGLTELKRAKNRPVEPYYDRAPNITV